MGTVQNLYNVFKLKASYIVKNDCNIPSYTIHQGMRDDNIVAIGDNIIFQQLRYLHGDHRNHKEIFAFITKLRNNSHAYKKQGDFKKARILTQCIIDTLFVHDIINVFIDGKKSDFNKFRTSGFYVNGIHYVYLCSGSGQIRRNTATFVNAEYQQKLIKTLNCGLTDKTKQFSLAKYSAYFALAFSSILWVRTPRVCVIKDFYKTLKNENVDFIVKDADNNGFIEKRVMDLELNCADGQGLIDPYFAQLWAKDMNLPYTPCSFVARSCFIKGNLVPIDFKEYAHQHNIFTIKDRWGTEYNIDDIDVLLSESQFKTAKYYNSWEDYQSYAKAGNIHWGVARYNKQNDDEYILSNYQYIQALSLSTEDIKKLIQPTVDWIQQVCSGDRTYALLYSFGSKSDTINYSAMYGTAQTTVMKAIVRDNDFLEDSYIRNKIYKNIVETINSAKLGKIWIRGNYQFCIADPLAQVQSALGLPPVGIVKRDEVWSQFWVDRGAKKIDLCRSPMIDVHEHNPCSVLYSEEANYWFRYINSGIIYSTYDTSCFRQEDSDYDGDIVLSTDNEFFIKGSHKDHNIITYEKGNYAPAKITIPNITKTVLKGFGTGVGGFSNTATIMYAMAPIFNKPGHEDQYAEIMTRIKLLREIVGQEIDRIKGADKPIIPLAWRKVVHIEPTDDKDTVYKKMRQNALVISKKPYFFRYLYPELNQRFKQFEASYNLIARDQFGMKFKKLLKKEDKTQEEKMLVRRYQKYSPLITAPCTMNILCREFENIDFDIKYDKTCTNVTHLPDNKEKYQASFNPEKLAQLRAIYSSYAKLGQLRHYSSIASSLTSNQSTDPITGETSTFMDQNDYNELHLAIYDSFMESLRDQLESLDFQDVDEFLFYCHRLADKNSAFKWGFAWALLEDKILDSIPRASSICPVRDSNGSIEYLGEHYTLKDLTIEEISSVDDSLDSISQDQQDITLNPETSQHDDNQPDEALFASIYERYKDSDIMSDILSSAPAQEQNEQKIEEGEF